MIEIAPSVSIEHFAPGIAARLVHGAGEGVLWVHGYTIDATTWEEIWSLLPGWTHIGIDLPDHGNSEPLAPDGTLTALGGALADAALRHRVRHVVGLSLGSMIALQVVLSRPTAFTTLTMAAPALAGGPVEAAVGIRFMELNDLYHRRGPGPWMTELWMRSPPETFSYAPQAVHARLAAVIERHAWREFAHMTFGVAGFARQAQNWQELRNARPKLQIVIGQRELTAFRQTASILQEVRPDAAVMELPGTGHLCLLQAAEASARLLAEHWSG